MQFKMALCGCTEIFILARGSVVFYFLQWSERIYEVNFVNGFKSVFAGKNIQTNNSYARHNFKLNFCCILPGNNLSFYSAVEIGSG